MKIRICGTHRARPMGVALTLLSVASWGAAAPEGSSDSASAIAAETSWPLRVAQASVTWARESNLLKASDAEVANPGASPNAWDDTVRAASLRLGWDGRISRQRVSADLELARRQYSRYSLYNHDEHAVRLGWDWETAGHLSGFLRAQDRQHLGSLRPYGSYGSYGVSGTEAGTGGLPASNLESTRQIQGLARWGLASTQAVEVSLESRRVENSASTARSNDYRQADGGLAWRSSPMRDLSWTVGLRATRGTYPHAPITIGLENTTIADHFQGRYLDITLFWVPGSEASTHQWDGRLSSGRTTYDVDTQRNISGLFGRVHWRWRPLGLLRLDTSWTRDPGQDAYFATAAASVPPTPSPPRASSIAPIEATRLTHKLQALVSADLSAKTQLQLGAASVRRSLAGMLGTPHPENGQDRSALVSLGLAWQPTRSVSGSCEWAREQRTGEAPWSSSFHNRSVSCQAQLTLK